MASAAAAPVAGYGCSALAPDGATKVTIQLGADGECPSATTPATREVETELVESIEDHESVPTVCPASASASAAPAAALGGGALVAAAAALGAALLA